MKVAEIIDILEEKIPLSLAYDWDNVGLLVGDKGKEVKTVFLTLDINLKTVSEAISVGADMIITHHPMFFDEVKSLNYDLCVGKTVKLLIENNIAVYAAHTNMDVAKGGLNDVFSKKLGLKNVKIIETTDASMGAGLGRYGELENTVSLGEFCDTIIKVLNTPIRYTGDDKKEIKTVGVATGACQELIEKARDLGCDVLVTADLKYHRMMDASDLDFALIDAGHYPTEVFVKEIFKDIIKDTGLNIIESMADDVFKFRM